MYPLPQRKSVAVQQRSWYDRLFTSIQTGVREILPQNAVLSEDMTSVASYWRHKPFTTCLFSRVEIQVSAGFYSSDYFEGKSLLLRSGKLTVDVPMEDRGSVEPLQSSEQ